MIAFLLILLYIFNIQLSTVFTKQKEEMIFLASDDAIQLLVLTILIVLSAFFSSAETAMTTVNRIRLQALSEEGSKRAAMVLDIKENSSRMLSAILIGNNLVNNFAAALATALAIRLVGSGAVGIVTGILTVLILVFGEITPKTIAASNSEKLALAYAPVIYALVRIMTPVIFVINQICRFFLRLLHIDTNGESAMTEMELRTIVDVSHKDGVIEKSEREMIYNVVDFGDSEAKDVMVPRADMVTISTTTPHDEIYEIFRTEKYTRLPVYQDDRANIVGILNIKDFFFSNDSSDFRVTDLMYEPYFTYEFKKTSELLMEMQKNSVSVSIVLDEYGSSVGMISIEDLLEEIVGEIRDEYDEDEEDLIRKVSDLEYLIEGSVKLDDINNAIGLSLSSEDYDSLGGLAIEKLDHLPREGESVTIDGGISLKIKKMDKNRIALVRLKLPKPIADPENTEENPPSAAFSHNKDEIE